MRELEHKKCLLIISARKLVASECARRDAGRTCEAFIYFLLPLSRLRSSTRWLSVAKITVPPGVEPSRYQRLLI